MPGAGSADPEQIDLLARGYVRDRVAHEEEAVRDLLAPPPRPEKRRQLRRGRPGPIPRGLPEPAELVAPLLGREARRYGPRTRAADLEDRVLASRMVHVAQHSRRLSPQDRAVQTEFTERRALTYQALASNQAALLARTLPDVLVPLVGARSRVRQGVIGVMVAAIRMRKTGAALGRTEWCKILFCGTTQINDVLIDLEEEGWIEAIARYRPANEHDKRRKSNFFIPGPRLLELVDVILEPGTMSEAKAAAAEQLRHARRRHAARIHRGPHRPQPYLEPEEWVREKAAADVAALEEEARLRAAREAASEQLHGAELHARARRQAAGEAAGDVLAEHLEQLDALAAAERARPLELAPELLAEHKAAITLIGLTTVSGDPSLLGKKEGLERNTPVEGAEGPPRTPASGRRRPRRAAPTPPNTSPRSPTSPVRGRQGGCTTHASAAPAGAAPQGASPPSSDPGRPGHDAAASAATTSCAERGPPGPAASAATSCAERGPPGPAASAATTSCAERGPPGPAASAATTSCAERGPPGPAASAATTSCAERRGLAAPPAGG